MLGSRRGAALLVVAACVVTGIVVAVGSALGGRSTPTAAAPPGALALQSAFVNVVRVVSPSVVQIETSQGLGSGVVFDRKGNIVTNAHVVGTARKFTVTTSSGKRLDAMLVGKFEANDLAVIRVSAALNPASFADSSKLKVGSVVLAIGNPLGLRSSVTQGIVSALGLLGRVVGIPTLAASDPQLGGGAAPGIGFAIPSNVVRDIGSQLVKHGHVVNSHRAYLGIQAGDTNGNGVYVGAIVNGSPAAKAGLHVGDVIVSIAGKPTPTLADLATVLATLRPGQNVSVAIVEQNGKKATIRLTLGELPG